MKNRIINLLMARVMTDSEDWVARHMEGDDSVSVPPEGPYRNVVMELLRGEAHNCGGPLTVAEEKELDVIYRETREKVRS